MSGDRVVIGHIQRAHGIRGALRVRATGATLGGLRPGEHVTLSHGGRERELRVQDVHGDLLELEGVDDRDAADALRGSEILVPADRLPPPAEADEFYVRDLLGCVVVAGDRVVGQVRQVLERPANDVLEIAPEHGEPVLLPFTHDAILSVDTAARTIRVRPDLLDIVD